jgi:hypothetical protein
MSTAISCCVTYATWLDWTELVVEARKTTSILLQPRLGGGAMIKYDRAQLLWLVYAMKQWQQWQQRCQPPLLLKLCALIVNKIDDTLEDFVMFYARTIHRLVTHDSRIHDPVNEVVELLLYAAATTQGSRPTNEFAAILSPYFVAHRVGRLVSFLLWDANVGDEAETNGIADVARLNSMQLRRRWTGPHSQRDDKLRERQHDFLALLGLIFYVENKEIFKTQFDPLYEEEGIYKFEVQLKECAPYLIILKDADDDEEGSIKLHDRMLTDERGHGDYIGEYYQEADAPIYGNGEDEMFEFYDMTPPSVVAVRLPRLRLRV